MNLIIKLNIKKELLKLMKLLKININKKKLILIKKFNFKGRKMNKMKNKR